MAVWLKADDLRCSVCLELLARPATLLCGHSFCLGCLRRWAEARARKGRERSCPNCQRAFSKRLPDRNVLLELLLEQYRSAASGGAVPRVARPPPAASQRQTQVRAGRIGQGQCLGSGPARHDRLRLRMAL